MYKVYNHLVFNFILGLSFRRPPRSYNVRVDVVVNKIGTIKYIHMYRKGFCPISFSSIRIRKVISLGFELGFFPCYFKVKKGCIFAQFNSSI